MKNNPWKVTTFVLAGALAAVVSVGQVSRADAEKQPQMRAALENLERAKNQLENATTDKGGHRVKALALTNEAIEQVKKGIAFDNKN
jgi:Spy/CpxP family protein refolding chaperone